MERPDFLLIGKIVGVHGIRGNLKVHSYAESSAIFTSGNQIWVMDASGSETPFEIKQGAPHKKGILLSLHGIENRDAAEKLVNAGIFIDKSVLPGLEEGEYYWSEIIGLEVFEKDKEYLGRVASIFPTGSNDVYVVKHPDSGKETLVPALESVVESVDIEQGTMHVNLPEGL